MFASTAIMVDKTKQIVNRIVIIFTSKVEIYLALQSFFLES